MHQKTQCCVVLCVVKPRVFSCVLTLLSHGLVCEPCVCCAQAWATGNDHQCSSHGMKSIRWSSVMLLLRPKDHVRIHQYHVLWCFIVVWIPNDITIYQDISRYITIIKPSRWVTNSVQNTFFRNNTDSEIASGNQTWQMEIPTPNETKWRLYWKHNLHMVYSWMPYCERVIVKEIQDQNLSSSNIEILNIPQFYFHDFPHCKPLQYRGSCHVVLWFAEL